jgi:hypothetical protein
VVAKVRPTKHALDGWYCPPFQAVSCREVFHVALAFSRQPPVMYAVGRLSPGVKMIPQLQKTLDALELAEKEMKRLHRDLEQSEVILDALDYEVAYAFNTRHSLMAMIDNVTVMLEKREKKALEQLRAQHRVQPTPLSLCTAEITGDNSRRG